MFDERFRATFNYYFDEAQKMRNEPISKQRKWRDKQNAGHKNKVVKSRRKKNKNARKARKQNR